MSDARCLFHLNKIYDSLGKSLFFDDFLMFLSRGQSFLGAMIELEEAACAKACDGFVSTDKRYSSFFELMKNNLPNGLNGLPIKEAREVFFDWFDKILFEAEVVEINGKHVRTGRFRILED